MIPIVTKKKKRKKDFMTALDFYWHNTSYCIVGYSNVIYSEIAVFSKL